MSTKQKPQRLKIIKKPTLCEFRLNDDQKHELDSILEWEKRSKRTAAGYFIWG